MSRNQITPPAALAVALADARLDLKEPDAALNPQIEMMIAAMTEEAEHKTGRVCITQTWGLTLDAFGTALRLDGSPLASVTSITYYDADNVLQTLDPQDYDVDNKTEPGYVVPAVGVQWPETYERPNAVTVTYVCGYGDTDASVPASIKMYIRARVVAHFDGAPPLKDGERSQFDFLLDRHKVY